MHSSPTIEGSDTDFSHLPPFLPTPQPTPFKAVFVSMVSLPLVTKWYIFWHRVRVREQGVIYIPLPPLVVTLLEDQLCLFRTATFVQRNLLYVTLESPVGFAA